MQTIATSLVMTASIANEDYSGALGDGIQVWLTGLMDEYECMPAHTGHAGATVPPSKTSLRPDWSFCLSRALIRCCY